VRWALKQRRYKAATRCNRAAAGEDWQWTSGDNSNGHSIIEEI